MENKNMRERVKEGVVIGILSLVGGIGLNGATDERICNLVRNSYEEIRSRYTTLKYKESKDNCQESAVLYEGTKFSSRRK